jgi:large subunit ribosomal protein L6
MSRIGKMPIELPKGVNVDVKGSEVVVKGSKGTLSQTVAAGMAVKIENNVLQVERPNDERQNRALHGLTRALLNNMVVGVSTGFTRKLMVEGVGYRAEVEGKNLILHVGYSHPVEMVPPADIEFVVENRGKEITVTGIDKQVLGEVCAKIRKTRPPEPYKGKGIRYEGEFVRRKAGKAGKV